MNQPAGAPGPILIAHLLAQIDARLIELLRALSPGDWEKQTVSPKWKVRDVAAHLLDTQLRKLSVARDGYVAETITIRSTADLVVFINRLNEEGVRFLRRFSSPVLIAMMEVASRESAAFHQALDPFAPATFAVSWAGEATSPNWFDTAREYTERWHHQQQIREAVNRPGIMTRELYYPVLDCFMRGLPYAYRELPAAAGTLLQVEVAGECGGTWYLYREGESWRLLNTRVGTPAAQVIIPQEIAWRIFTKGIDSAAAAAYLKTAGDRQLALHVLRLTAIVG